ncbi:MAG: energy transducer TonB [Acidobacteriota bacterium]
MFSIKGSLSVVSVFLLACSLSSTAIFAQSKRKKPEHSKKQPMLKPVKLPSLFPIDSSEVFIASKPAPEPSFIPTGDHQDMSDRPGMSADKGQEDLVPYERAKELLQTIGLNTAVPVKFENPQNSPLVIVSADLEIKKIRRPHRPFSDLSEVYVMETSIKFSNATSKPIKAFGIYFLKIGYSDPDELPYIHSTGVGPYNTFTFQMSNTSTELSWLQNPEQLMVKVAGIVFADNSIWEEQAESKYIFENTVKRFPDESQEEADSKPALLSSPSSRYTEEARKNKIEGSVQARALIGADGKVKSVRITSGLPDGLNEEAIWTIYRMLFKPAMKNGIAITYWMKVDIEFKIQ